MVKPFAIAAKAVEVWFAEAGAPFATRVAGLSGGAKPMAWEFKVPHARLLHDIARLTLPRDFPSAPAQIYLHKDHCLVLPHVEETGKVCLGVEASPVQGVPALASSWVSDRVSPNMFDLVVDCTGESSVRALLSQYRQSAFVGTPIVHTWLEPFCAAAHVVLVGAADVWPMSDPADALVNAAEWPESTKHEIPACGAGFHPYGVADAWQAAGFAAERLLNTIDRASDSSAIWSWVRSKAYFDALNVGARPRAIVPVGDSEYDSKMLSRDYNEVLNPNA